MEIIDPFQPYTETNSDAKTFGMLCHIASLAGLIVPFGSILGPLVVWLIKKNEFKYVDDQGKEALNFNLTIALAFFIAFMLFFFFIGFFLMIGIFFFWLVSTVIAGVKANDGTPYRYPISIKFIS